jgi:hypothetical protein
MAKRERSAGIEPTTPRLLVDKTIEVLWTTTVPTALCCLEQAKRLYKYSLSQKWASNADRDGNRLVSMALIDLIRPISSECSLAMFHVTPFVFA